MKNNFIISDDYKAYRYHKALYWKPITKNFGFVDRFNGWAKLINNRTEYGEKLYYVQHSPNKYVKVFEEKFEKIENKPCYKPFPAIRKWKIWLLYNFYGKRKCFTCDMFRFTRM